MTITICISIWNMMTQRTLKVLVTDVFNLLHYINTNFATLNLSTCKELVYKPIKCLLDALLRQLPTNGQIYPDNYSSTPRGNFSQFFFIFNFSSWWRKCPTLNAFYIEFWAWGKRWVAKGVASLSSSMVKISIKPKSKPTITCTHHQVGAGTLKNNTF